MNPNLTINIILLNVLGQSIIQFCNINVHISYTEMMYNIFWYNKEFFLIPSGPLLGDPFQKNRVLTTELLLS